ncbi:MAG: DEAD/DEAH box helicase family protein [Anaerolineaceae bacterium]|nr:DEAD/DEAH box helicase family protein [Anaerolineaceae bacterium]
MPTLITLDLETTGLDPESDAITEIGVVKFVGNQIEDEYSTLINPNKRIPQEITQLTGITNSMVKNAPQIEEVLPDLIDFIGNCPIIGHNIGFDLAFLHKFGIFIHNEAIDTYELASVLMPGSPRYSLEALTLSLGFPLKESHRALEDARNTTSLFNYLYEKSLELPIEMVADFVRFSDPFNWGASWLFKSVLKARSSTSVPSRKSNSYINNLLAPSNEMFLPPLPYKDEINPLELDEISSLMDYGGPFAAYFDQYEHRPQQIEMMRSIAEAFNESMHLMVEAGTGTGKSFAYLIPAAYWALENQKRVVISTNTINLQDQLISKDIPDLKNALNLELNATVLKGRSNYLCPRKLEAMRQRGPSSIDEMRVLGKVLVWIFGGGSGDRNEINIHGHMDFNAWNKLSADDENCNSESCLNRIGGVCPFYQAHQKAQSSQLVIVNHALLLSDVASGSRILPEYNYLIIDEAHHLEAATTNALSYQVDQTDIIRMIKELGGSSSGLLSFLLNKIKGVVSPTELAQFSQKVSRITDLLYRFEADNKNFFKAIDQFLYEERDGYPINSYGQQVRLTSASRTIYAWEGTEITWDTASETLGLLLNLVEQLIKDLNDLNQKFPEEIMDVMGSVSSVFRRLSEVNEQVSAFVSEPDTAFIYWIEIQAVSKRITMKVAPIHVGSLMENHLWYQKSSIILTSATLTTNGSFDYIRGRLNAEDTNELALGSPFDYQNSALLFLANDIPEPNDRTNYQRAVENTLINLSKSTDGRMLALFTSYMQLKQTSKSISSILSKEGFEIFEQGKGASANALLESFKKSEKGILLGTRSFWEGVDIPGDSLSVLVILKLPFNVPSDPIIASRSETFEDPFFEYHIPEAILRFRQGFGRLIRTDHDRGIVAVLDKRIISKRYGKMFIDSLPDCTIRQGALSELPLIASRWLNM